LGVYLSAGPVAGPPIIPTPSDPYVPLKERIDRVLYLLFAGMVFFSIMLLYVEHFFKDDGQLFQVVSGLITGFAGAFFTRLKSSPTKD